MPCHTSSSLHSSFHPSILFNDSWCCTALIMQGCCVTPAVCCCYLLFIKLVNGSCRKVVTSLSHLHLWLKVMWLPSLLGCSLSSSSFIHIMGYDGVSLLMLTLPYSSYSTLHQHPHPAPPPSCHYFCSLLLLVLLWLWFLWLWLWWFTRQC